MAFSSLQPSTSYRNDTLPTALPAMGQGAADSTPEQSSLPNKDSFLGTAVKTSQAASAAMLKPPYDNIEQERAAVAAAIQASLCSPKTSPVVERGGLFNLGNTCWFNAITQAIFKLGTPYRKALEVRANMAMDPKLSESGQLIKADQKRLAKSYLKMIEESEGSAIGGSNGLYGAQIDFQHSFSKSCPHLNIGSQHDASEGFHSLCQYLQIDEILPQVSIQTHIQSSDLRYSSLTHVEKATSLVLASRSARSISEAIAENLIKSESLNGPNAWSPSELNGQTVDAEKKDYLTAPFSGHSIIVQVPRFTQTVIPARSFGGFTFQQKSIRRERNNASIEVNSEIEIPLYNQEGTEVKTVLKMRAKTVVAHRSSYLGGGHYVAYDLHEDGSSTCYNDSSVKRYNSSATSDLLKKEGYLVVYEKVAERDANAGEFPTIQASSVAPLAALPANHTHNSAENDEDEARQLEAAIAASLAQSQQEESKDDDLARAIALSKQDLQNSVNSPQSKGQEQEMLARAIAASKEQAASAAENKSLSKPNTSPEPIASPTHASKMEASEKISSVPANHPQQEMTMADAYKLRMLVIQNSRS